MSTIIRRKIMLVLFLPLIIMAAVSLLLLWQVQSLTEAAAWVDHTDAVLAKANLAQKLILDQETGLRGFLLTRQPEFKQPLENSQQVLPTILDDLEKLTSDQPGQTDNIRRLKSQHQLWLNDSTSAMAMRADGPPPPNELLVQARGRKVKMDLIRATVDRITKVETGLLNERRARAAELKRNAIIVSAIVLGIAAVLLAGIIRRTVNEVEKDYMSALAERETSLIREKNARQAAEALASEIAERGKEIEQEYISVRQDRDTARRRLAELGQN